MRPARSPVRPVPAPDGSRRRTGARLFLDELGTLSMGAQERLLRAVEYGEVTRIGSSRPIRVDVRIVGATNEHLPDRVAKAAFAPICSTG